MRVLEISLRADRSGGPRHLLSLLRNFPPGVEAYVAAPDGEAMSGELKRLAAGFLPCPHRRFTLPALWRMRAFVRAHGIEVIHSHGRGAGVYSRLLGRWTGRPVVHTLHGVHVAAGLKSKIKGLADHFLRNAATIYILVSDDERKAAIHKGWLGHRPHEVIPNGIEIPLAPIAPAARAGPLNMGQIARLDPVKGLDLLNERMSFILARTPAGLTLTTAGVRLEDLPFSPELKAITTSLGIIEDPNRLFEKLDLYVSTSRNEGLPLSVLEAMAAGVPCLLSRVPGHDGLIEAGAARGFTLTSPQSFVEEFQALRDSPEARAALGRRGREHVLKHHTAQEMAERTALVYARAMEKG